MLTVAVPAGAELALLICAFCMISVAAQGGDEFTDPVEALGVDYNDLESQGLDRYSVPIIVVFYIVIMGALVVFCQLVYWPDFLRRMNSVVQSRLSRFLYKQKIFGTPLIILHELLMAFMGFVSCVIFLFLSVMVTEGQGEIFTEPVIIWTEFLLGWFFLGDYFVHFILAPDKLMYVFDVSALVNLLSFVPAVIAPIIFRFFYGFDFLRAVHIYRAFSVIESSGWLPIPPHVPFAKDKPVRLRQFIQHWMFVTKTLLLLFTYIFCMACFFFVTENLHQNPDGQVDDMLDSVYFVFVTVSTVGYGDFSPQSRVGKVVVIIFIMLCLVTLVPMMLVFADRVKDAWNTRWYLGTNHILVCGDSENVLHFCEEFYAERRNPYEETRMVVMHSQALPEDVNRKLLEARFSKYVRVMQGDATSEFDLKRAGLQQANRLVILADSANSNRYQEDLRIVTRVDSAKRFVPGVEVFAQVLGKTDTIRAMGVKEAFEVQKFFYALIAQSCFTGGLSTLVSNLVLHSDMPQNSRKWDGVRKKALSEDTWEDEYLRGCNMGIWPTLLPEEVVGKSFSQLVHEAYTASKGKTLIVGIRGGLQRTRSKIDLLNPGRHYVIKRGDVAYVIAGHRRHPRRMREKMKSGLSDPLGNYLYRASPAIIHNHLPDASLVGQEMKRLGDEGVNATRGFGDPMAALNFMGGNEQEQRVEVDLDKAKAIIGQVRNIDGPAEKEAKEARSFESLVKDPSIPRDARLLTELSNHILIVGWHDDVVYLLQGMRNERLATHLRQRKIVLLIPDTVEVPAKTWAKVATLRKICIIRYEHPLSKSDLHSAGVQFASKLILMNDVNGITFDNPEEVVAMTDANVVALWRRLYREMRLTDLDAIALLEKNENAKYFDDKTHQPIMEVDSLRSPAYAAGRIVFSGAHAKFVAACLFNSGLQCLARQMTEASVVRMKWQELADGSHTRRASMSSQIAGSEDLAYHLMDGVTYGMMVEKLILGESVCILPLGLYRTRKALDKRKTMFKTMLGAGRKGLSVAAQGATQAAAMVGGEDVLETGMLGLMGLEGQGKDAVVDKNSYVMTNPPPDTVLLDDDELFVLFPNESNWKGLQKAFWQRKTKEAENNALAASAALLIKDESTFCKSEDDEAVELEEILASTSPTDLSSEIAAKPKAKAKRKEKRNGKENKRDGEKQGGAKKRDTGSKKNMGHGKGKEKFDMPVESSVEGVLSESISHDESSSEEESS